MTGSIGVNETQPMPDVSVIIPAYNRADLLGEAIESTLTQTRSSVEAIIVDDGSTDDTRSVVAAYHDPRVRYVYQMNAGLAAARNSGIRQATGRYVAFLDADDLFLPGKLACQVPALDAQPAVGLVAGGYIFADITGHPMAEAHPWRSHPSLNLQTLLVGCPIIVNSVLIRREWLTQVGGFDTNLRRVEDWDLWLRLAHAGCLMAWTPEVLCVYRMHPGQMVRDGQSQEETALAVLNKFFAQPGLEPSLWQARNTSYTAAYLSGAFRKYAAGQLTQAAESLSRAIELAPSLLTGSQPLLADVLIAWATNPIIGDPGGYLNTVLMHLPPSASKLQTIRSRLYGLVALQVAVNAQLVGNLDRAGHTLTQAVAQDRALLADSQLLIDALSDIISRLEPAAQEPALQRFFDCLPEACAVWRSQRARVFGQWMAGQGFAAYRAGAERIARGRLLRAIRCDRRWLLNRGVWSIIWRSFGSDIRVAITPNATKGSK
jgi:hypothetical protein